MKNIKSAVKNVSCTDRNHLPLAVLALAGIIRH
jgi:hypothetical protein